MVDAARLIATLLEIEQAGMKYGIVSISQLAINAQGDVLRLEQELIATLEDNETLHLKSNEAFRLH
jgi:hypothetical protein